MIDAKAMKLVSVRITLPIYEWMEGYCSAHKMKRSEFIRLAITRYLQEKGEQTWQQ